MNENNLAPGLAGRQLAISWLEQCLRQQMPFDEVLKGAASVSRIDPRDRNLARLIVLTTLRRQIQIDQILKKFLLKGIPRKSGNLREILQTAVAQLLFLEMPAHAVVDCAIRLARKDRNARHLKNLANGVLRNIAREGTSLISQGNHGRINTPDWLWKTWVAAYGEEGAESISAAHLHLAPLDLTVIENPGHWAEKLGGEILPTGSVRLKKSGPVTELDGYAEGAWWVQDTAASIPVRLFSDLNGKRVADLCAAPGGKTAQLATIGAEVTAIDISDSRLKRLQDNLDRLKLKAQLITADVAKWTPKQQFDAVLLDAPCSSTGTIRRHPDIQHLKQPQHITTLTAKQDLLLDKAYHFLKPGAELVYCVCSLQKAEGENRIEKFLRAHPDMQRSPIDLQPLGLTETALTMDGDIRLRPDMFSEQGGMDGFFISVLNRR